MLILDGMPGAGKTTLLGTLLTQWQAVVFPEAQPPEHGDEATTMRHLLDEDHARTTESASATPTTTPAATARHTPHARSARGVNTRKVAAHTMPHQKNYEPCASGKFPRTGCRRGDLNPHDH